MNEPISWSRLRSDIYIRDKGMCWICNTFVKLDDYDLGHIIDRCNGGHDDYDNLAVMHKPCNLSKPMHLTLEEALKWKLTAFIPSIYEARGNSQFEKPLRVKRNIHKIYHIKPSTLARREALYKEHAVKIKPGTICWVQGRPEGGAMWRVLPPPYKKECMFIMRITPPGAKDVKNGGIKDTLQLLGGELLNDIHIDIGCLHFYITPDNGKPHITFTTNKYSNIGAREETVGMGDGQIPIDVWLNSKAKGISLYDFKNMNLKTSPDISDTST